MRIGLVQVDQAAETEVPYTVGTINARQALPRCPGHADEARGLTFLNLRHHPREHPGEAHPRL